jgi:hypothetical protein
MKEVDEESNMASPTELTLYLLLPQFHLHSSGFIFVSTIWGSADHYASRLVSVSYRGIEQ